MTDYNQHKIMVRLLIHVRSQVNSLQMQPSPVNKWYNATQNWRKNKSTTLFAVQIHTYDCPQYCIIECLKILIIYDDTPLKILCETKYTYTTKSNRINRNEIQSPEGHLFDLHGAVRMSSGADAKCSGTVCKSSGAVGMCYGAVTKLFRNSSYVFRSS